MEIKAAKEFFKAEYRGNKFVLKFLKKEIRNFLSEDEEPVLIFQTHKNVDIVNGVKRKIGKHNTKTIFVLNCKPDVYGFVYNGEMTRSGERFSGLPFDAYIAVSKSVKKEFIDWGLAPPEKVEYISNGVPLHVYSPLDKNERNALRTMLGIKTPYVIGYSGRVTKNKGVDIVLELMQLFEDNFDNLFMKDFSFLFALSGDGERRDFINQIMLRFPNLVNSGRVSIVINIAKYTNGYSPEIVGEVKDYLLRGAEDIDVPFFKGLLYKPLQAISDVVIQPSYSESFSFTVLESLAVGTPVVAIDSGGPSELIRNMGGYLITVDGVKHCDGKLILPEKEVLIAAKDFFDNIGMAIEDTLTNPKLKEEMIVAVKRSGRTAERMAERIDELIWQL